MLIVQVLQKFHIFLSFVSVACSTEEMVDGGGCESGELFEHGC
jgi:hypothetical protein